MAIRLRNIEEYIHVVSPLSIEGAGDLQLGSTTTGVLYAPWPCEVRAVGYTTDSGATADGPAVLTLEVIEAAGDVTLTSSFSLAHDDAAGTKISLPSNGVTASEGRPIQLKNVTGLTDPTLIMLWIVMRRSAGNINL